jgi:hypothetical protein
MTVYKGFQTAHQNGLILKSDTNTFEVGATSIVEAMILAMDPMGDKISYIIKDGKFLLFEIVAGAFEELMNLTIYLYEYYNYDNDNRRLKQNNMVILEIGNSGWLIHAKTWNEYESDIEVVLYKNDQLQDLDIAAIYEESKASRTVVNEKFMKMIYGQENANTRYYY